MKAFKRFTAAALLIACILGLAAAEGAPASQFGVKGWPYRNKTTCTGKAVQASTPTPVRATPAPERNGTPESSPSSVDVGDYTTLSVSAQEYSAWNLLNQDREANGKAPLPLDETLCAIARIKSQDMKENRYFSHTSPTFGKAASMLKLFGYSFKSVGENIAHHSTVEKSEAAFLSSTNHRINMLGSQWKKVGIGVCYDDQGFVYVTQLFVR